MAINDDILELAESMNCPELYFINDKKVGLKGVIAIHSTKLGPSLGGCRWLEYNSTYDAANDAIRLAQGMSYKAAISGLPLGGGKAVIIKPKGDIDKISYFKTLGKFINNLGGRYITAVDSGTSTEEMDLIALETSYVSNTSHTTYSSHDPSPITARGVFAGIKAAVKHKFKTDSLKDLTIAIQGIGHVGYPLAKLLHEASAKLIVFDSKKDTVAKCVKEFGAKGLTSADEIFEVDCDIFAPCAMGAIINSQTIPLLKAKIIAGGANNQLRDPAKDAKLLLEKGILYAPDFVINAGGVIYVSGEYVGAPEVESIKKVDQIYDTLTEIFSRSAIEHENTYEVAHTVAIERLNGE